MRAWKILATILGVCALVLMLSALVEAPAALPETAEQPAAPVAMTMLPAAVLPAVDAAEALRESQAPVRFAVVFVLMVAAALTVVGRDANGRVLRKKRYAQSFYPLFRLELACG